MFLPKGFTDAVNGSVVYPTDKAGRDLLPRFRRKAKTLPVTARDSVLRHSTTGASTRPKVKRGRNKVGLVGLAFIDAEQARKDRQAASAAKAFDALAKASKTA